MELLIIPSVLAISIKIGIFLRYHTSLRRENLELGIFFLAVFFLNIFELLSIKTEFSEQTSLLILLSYYCSVVFIIHGFINVSLHYSQFKWHTATIKTALNVILAALVVAIIFSRSLIAAAETLNGFTLTAVTGDFYWVIRAYLLLGLSFAVGLLIHGMRQGSSNVLRQKCLVVLISSATPVMVAVGVTILMSLGVHINAAIFMSLALSLMLGLMVYAEEKTRLFRLLTIVPYTRERQLHRQLLSKITDCVSISDDPTLRSLNLRQMMKELEGSVVEHVLSYYGGNQKKAASALGVSEATVSRRTRAATYPTTDALSSD
jgi:hypothetical protein